MSEFTFSGRRQQDKGTAFESLQRVLELYKRFCFVEFSANRETQKILEEYLVYTSQMIFSLALKEHNALSLKLYLGSQYIRRVLQEFRNSDPQLWDPVHLEEIRNNIDQHFKAVIHDPFSFALTRNSDS